MGISVALREWCAVVDALGQGIQTVMVRGYPPKYAEFLLYPTFSFYTSNKARPDLFEDKFQAQYLDMARNSAIRTVERAQDCYVDFDYYAQIDEVVPIEDSKIWNRLKPYFIWSVEHVEQYAGPGSFLWLVRVYRLPETVTIGRTAGGGPPTFYKHPEEISTAGATPVLSDSKYREIRNKLLPMTKSRAALVD